MDLASPAVSGTSVYANGLKKTSKFVSVLNQGVRREDVWG